VKTTPADIKKGFKRAFAEPWPERLRYEGDGRPFWRYAVATATGCADEAYFEELYQPSILQRVMLGRLLMEQLMLLNISVQLE